MGAKWAFQRDIGHTGDFVLLLFYYQGAEASLYTANQYTTPIGDFHHPIYLLFIQRALRNII